MSRARYLFALLLTAGLAGEAAAAVLTDQVNVTSNESPGAGHALANNMGSGGRFVVLATDAMLTGQPTGGHDQIFLRDRKKGLTFLISQNSAGVPGNGASFDADVSPNGRFVTFTSEADNLAGIVDPAASLNVYLRDRKRGLTFLISQSSSETAGNQDSQQPSISRTGRFVTFSSDADNLVGGDTNGADDVFVRDRKKGRTFLISQTSSEIIGNDASVDPSISGSGRFVTFESNATNLTGGLNPGVSQNVFLRDRKRGLTFLVSQSSTETAADDDSNDAEISANGRFIAFDSRADNLAAGLNPSASQNVFVRDRVRGRTLFISQSSSEVAGDATSSDPKISGSGRFVAFESDADNLAVGINPVFQGVFVRDRRHGKTYLISQGPNGAADDDSSLGGISRNGRFVAFSSHADNLSSTDNNGFHNAFVRGRLRYPR